MAADEPLLRIPHAAHVAQALVGLRLEPVSCRPAAVREVEVDGPGGPRPRGRVWGFIQFNRDGAFSEGELAFVEGLAPSVGRAVRTALLTACGQPLTMVKLILCALERRPSAFEAVRLSV